ncbi:MAG: histidine phosphatase family protein [Dongiaceae bacterium]
MTTRITWISSGATAATHRAAFGSDEGLESKAREQALPLTAQIGSADRIFCSPDLAARQTADALGVTAAPDPALGEIDFGRWKTRTLLEIEATEPAALVTWVNDPAAAPHGGESIAACCERIGFWLERETQRPGRVLVVGPANCIRAAVLHCLQAPLTAFRRLDIAPLSFTSLSFNGGQWRVQATGCRFKQASPDIAG